MTLPFDFPFTQFGTLAGGYTYTVTVPKEQLNRVGTFIKGSKTKKILNLEKVNDDYGLQIDVIRNEGSNKAEFPWQIYIQKINSNVHRGTIDRIDILQPYVTTATATYINQKYKQYVDLNTNKDGDLFVQFVIATK